MRRLNPSTARKGRGGKTAGGSARRGAGRGAIRRRPLRRWQIALLQAGGGLAALGVVAAGSGWLWQSGWVGRTWDSAVTQALVASGEAGLALREVLVEGRQETSTDALMSALDVEVGQPILALSPGEIKDRVERLPWVESASVERRLPDTLYLRVREYEPMALWQRSQQLVLVSRSGEPIDEPQLGRFADLLVIVGDGAPTHAPALLDMLALKPELARRVTAAIWVSDRRWNLRIDNDIDVKLPEDDATTAWLELARLDREHGLLERDLEAIDLRVPERVVVRLSPDAIARYRAPAKDT